MNKAQEKRLAKLTAAVEGSTKDIATFVVGRGEDSSVKFLAFNFKATTAAGRRLKAAVAELNRFAREVAKADLQAARAQAKKEREKARAAKAKLAAKKQAKRAAKTSAATTKRAGKNTSTATGDAPKRRGRPPKAHPVATDDFGAV